LILLLTFFGGVEFGFVRILGFVAWNLFLLTFCGGVVILPQVRLEKLSAANWWLRSPNTATNLSNVNSSGVLSSNNAFNTNNGLRPDLSSTRLSIRGRGTFTNVRAEFGRRRENWLQAVCLL